MTMETNVMKRPLRCTLWIFAALLAVQFAPSPADGVTGVKPWKFVVLGDTRSNPCDTDGGVAGFNRDAVERLAVAVAAEKPDLVLVPGDIVLGNGYACRSPQPPPESPESQLRGWRRAMKPVYDSGARVLPVRGNHEMDRDAIMADWSSCRKRLPVERTILDAWRAVFNDPYIPVDGPPGQKGLTYAVPHKNALFVGFDQTVDQFQVEQKWFRQVLRGNRRTHLFTFGHYPAFAVKHRDSLSCYATARDRFWDAIGSAGGRIYFCGHDHFYDRSIIRDSRGRGIRQVLVGNGGAPLSRHPGGYPDPRVKGEERLDNSYGYLLVTVNGDEVTAKLKLLEPSGGWRTGDSFRYTVRHRVR
jgi:hypothetical protein